LLLRVRDEGKLIDQSASTTYLVDDEQDIAYIADDAALVVGQVVDVTCYALPVAVEVDPDEMPILVEDGAT